MVTNYLSLDKNKCAKRLFNAVCNNNLGSDAICALAEMDFMVIEKLH